MADDSDNGPHDGPGNGPGKQPARARVVLTDISSRAWEHPADKGALVALRKLRGFDTLLKALDGPLPGASSGDSVPVDDEAEAELEQILATWEG